MSLHGNIYNSFEDDTIFYLLKEEKVNEVLFKYVGKIGYKEDKIDIKFTYDTETNIVYVKTRYRYCMSLDDIDDYTKNVYTDSMSNEQDARTGILHSAKLSVLCEQDARTGILHESDIFAYFRFPKENKIIPISDVFNTIFSNKEVIIILDRDYSR